MRFTLTTAFAAALLVSEAVSASAISRPNHARLARRMNRQKRCLQRPTVSPNDYHQQATSTSSQVAAPAPTPDNSGNNNNNNNNGNTGGNNGNTGGVGTINAWSDVCGSPNASPNPSQTGGPNGEAIWLTCGISTGGGWSPPPVTRDNVICISLQDALNKPGSPFSACAPYLGSFQSYSAQTGIPETLLASIALQESGCNPGATGPNGEIGMMQITPDKCSGDCYNSDNNIGIGSRYFAGVVDSSGGNLVSAMGQYNGWFPGMTRGDADNHPSCGSRNNLDYLQNVFNGYCQGVDPSSWGVGFYNNIC